MGVTAHPFMYEFVPLHGQSAQARGNAQESLTPLAYGLLSMFKIDNPSFPTWMGRAGIWMKYNISLSFHIFLKRQEKVDFAAL